MHGRAVVFDLDGTLVDSREDLAGSVNAARTCFGLEPLPLAVITGHVGDGLGLLLERCFADAPETDLVQARAYWSEHYADHCCEETHAYPGVDETLRQLVDTGWDLGVVTNKPLSFSRAIIESLGWSSLLRAVVGGDRLRKPDPAPVFQVLACLGAPSASSWMVGDHRTDCDAGRSAGCRVAFCTWGIGTQAGRTVDVMLEQMDELPNILTDG